MADVEAGLPGIPSPKKITLNDSSQDFQTQLDKLRVEFNTL